MALSVGDRIPDVDVMIVEGDVANKARTGEVLGKGKVVLFAVPGAFTPTCSDYHLPGFIMRAEELRAAGADKICCIAVNDSFVMGAWAKDRGANNSVVMIADGNADFARAMGLDFDGSGFGMGVRSQRYAAILGDGIIRELLVEKGSGLDVSSADAVLARL